MMIYYRVLHLTQNWIWGQVKNNAIFYHFYNLLIKWAIHF